MDIKLIYNNDNTIVKIYGRSPVPVVITTEAVYSLFAGNFDNAYHEVKSLFARNLMPVGSIGSETSPLTSSIMHWAMKNKAAGTQVYKWMRVSAGRFEGVREQTGYDYVHGIAKESDHLIEFISGDVYKK